MSLTINEHTAQSEAAVARAAAVVCESTCCLPAELVRRYRIGILPIPFVFGTQTYRDGVDLTHAQFYEKLAATQTPPKTSPPAPGEYLEAWRAASRHAPNVISVTVDSKISTLQRSARLARDLSHEMLPGVSIVVVDSLSAGMGQGFVALAAARAVDSGASFTEAVARAEDVSRRVRLLVTLDTLDYLAKASRIPQVAAFLGGVLAIKPIIQIAGGDIRPVARVRSRRRSIEALFEQVHAAIPPGARVHVAVQHARAEAEALALETRLRDTFDCREVYTTEFTPIMGGYCGPGLLGVAFYSEADGDEG
ncbi:MAG: DegV family protein [Ktedonobacterales bacterium]